MPGHLSRLREPRRFPHDLAPHFFANASGTERFHSALTLQWSEAERLSRRRPFGEVRRRQDWEPWRPGSFTGPQKRGRQIVLCGTDSECSPTGPILADGEAIRNGASLFASRCSPSSRCRASAWQSGLSSPVRCQNPDMSAKSSRSACAASRSASVIECMDKSNPDSGLEQSKRGNARSVPSHRDARRFNSARAASRQSASSCGPCRAHS